MICLVCLVGVSLASVSLDFVKVVVWFALAVLMFGGSVLN